MATQNGASNGEIKESLVIGRTSQGMEIHATLIRLTRYLAVFEIYNPFLLLRASEILEDFKIVLRDRTVYSGRALVHSLVNAGPLLICEVTLHENSWTDVLLPANAAVRDQLRNEFKEFVQDWQKFYLVSHDYKVIIADLQTFLADLRLWLEQIELGIRSTPSGDRVKLEAEIAHGLRDPLVNAVNSLFDRFEEVADKIEPDLRPVHRAFGRRQLHPLLMCAPFMYRTYTKPLGYAGDYEMINMIIRNDYEGGSLFAKLVNAYLLDQIPPHAVRNRVGYLTSQIVQETSRVARMGGTARIWSLGCGPAREVENFVAEHPLAEAAYFRLLDFNDETLRYASGRMEEIKKKFNRKTEVKLVRNSVQNLLKTNSKVSAGDDRFDLIYCSGLYDYLSDRVCKALNRHLYDMLVPGGVLVVGNFAPHTPRQNLMEHFLEWFLVYRDEKQLSALAPDDIPGAECKVTAEPTGSNIFLEIRKPK